MQTRTELPDPITKSFFVLLTSTDVIKRRYIEISNDPRISIELKETYMHRLGESILDIVNWQTLIDEGIALQPELAQLIAREKERTSHEHQPT